LIKNNLIINIKEAVMKITGGNGLSIKDAIIISECSNFEGVKQEYLEIKRRFGNYKLIRQLLLEKDDKMYDKLELELENGKTIILYFDITDFLGKELF
jgi:hypothetical protein